MATLGHTWTRLWRTHGDQHRGRREYGGGWHKAAGDDVQAITSPSTGEALGTFSWAGVADVGDAVAAAEAGFRESRRVKPLQRARILREAATIIRANGRELALIDAADCGNPVAEMVRDAEFGAASLDYFAALVLEMKGATIPMGESVLNYTLRQPLGVMVRINAYNHPFMFSVVRAGAPLAAGNSLIIKPPEQAPLSSLRLAELIGSLFPAGAFNVLPGGRACGEALVAHPGVAKVGLIGSVPTGRAILRGAAETMKKVSLELGGKNALIAYADADPEKVAAGVAGGMNFTWCGQSCGSTSRAFLHESLHDEVLQRVAERVRCIKPGLPTRFDTQMGCLVSRAQYDKVLRYVAWGQEDGARLVCGGAPPSDPELEHGLFIQPAVFADARPGMRIAQEEIFGPVLSVFRWSDEAEMLRLETIGNGTGGKHRRDARLHSTQECQRRARVSKHRGNCMSTWLVKALTLRRRTASRRHRSQGRCTWLRHGRRRLCPPAANHILFDQGVVYASGHVSVRHDKRPDRFLLARNIAPGSVAAEDIVEFWRCR